MFASLLEFEAPRIEHALGTGEPLQAPAFCKPKLQALDYFFVGVPLCVPHIAVAGVLLSDGTSVSGAGHDPRSALIRLAGEAAELAEKARNKKLGADAMQGACFTISSLGHIGGTYFTPIVNSPEVAILGVSKATMQPVWDGKAFQPQLMLPLSLSYDHRAINGAAAAQFTKRLGELLGDIRSMLL